MKITKYEKARIIGARALQIAMGAPVLVKLTKDGFATLSYSPIEVAKHEFSEEALPISIKRPLPRKA